MIIFSAFGFSNEYCV